MNVEFPEIEKISKKRISIYLIAIAICILAIGVVIGVEVLGDDIINNIFGINKLVKRTEAEEAALKADFENIFDNKLQNIDNLTTNKKDENLEIVYTKYIKKEKTDKYEINIYLPYINIDNEHVEEFNQEMIDTFEEKAEHILNNEVENVIYNVQYKANIENNILSLIIYCDLKEGNTAQRIIVQTFNYDLEKNIELSLQDIVNKYDLKNKNVQEKINSNIKQEEEKAEELRKLGYTVFARDLNSEIYKIENLEEYFINDNNIYIIFAYGNYNITSEMDIVII